jgi:DNA-directed RNA polymerase II subunit RPB2
MMQSCVVAITTDNGFNIEDSIIINQSSLDRGLFRTYFSKTYKATESVHGADSERLGDVRDAAILGKKHSDYSKLEADGTPAVCAKIKQNDVVIGKYSSFNHATLLEGEHTTRRVSRDQSITVKERDNCIADKIVYATQKENSTLRQVTVRTTATYHPEMGDKFASRHAQKGICAITRRQEDMPRTAEGISPDLIFNPHGIPSRMTVGHLMEMVMGKGACLSGNIADGTPFRDIKLDEATKILRDRGYRCDGFERMYSGETGKMLRNPVFIGILSYQRLRHVVRNKIHARARGPRTVLTRAPVEGRSRCGAFRVGELQTSCFTAQGVSAIIKDRLLNCSDPHTSYVCKTCGKIAEKPSAPDSKIISVLHATAYCRVCDSNDNIVAVKIPYSFKLMLDEFQAMHFQTKLKVGV